MVCGAQTYEPSKHLLRIQGASSGQTRVGLARFGEREVSGETFSQLVLPALREKARRSDVGTIVRTPSFEPLRSDARAAAALYNRLLSLP